MAYRLAGAGEPLVELVEVHGVVERVHAMLVLRGGKLLGHAAADGLRRRVDGLERRVLVLEISELAIERIVDGIGQLGGILEVILVASALQGRT